MRRRGGRSQVRSVLVVAHPDDEVLWFSSILAKIDRVIFVFQDYAPIPSLGNRRNRAVAALPYPDVISLRIPECGSLNLADWAAPEGCPFGLRLTNASQEVADAYERNFRVVQETLAQELSNAVDVFTHNPWGEYGHEDHVQVYRAVEGLQRDRGFQLFVSSYISERTAPFASTYAVPAPGRVRRINTVYANQIAQIYKDHGCWTWDDGWVWPDAEWFFRGPIGPGSIR